MNAFTWANQAELDGIFTFLQPELSINIIQTLSWHFKRKELITRTIAWS
jgi:hypothetical protein